MRITNSVLNEHIGGLCNETSKDDKLILGLQESQKAILESIPNYIIKTILVGIGILVIFFSFQTLTGNLTDEQFQLFKSFKSLTIGGFLSFFFTFIAYAINAIFAVWAVSFTPYFAYKSYKALKE